MKCFNYIIFLFFLTSCLNKKKRVEKSTFFNKRIDTRKYDTVKFYKDAVWTSLEGIDEVSNSDLSYPYTAFAYKNGSIIEIFIVYSQDNIKVKHLKKYKDLQYVHSKYYNPEFKSVMYQYKFFNNDGSSITFDCENSFLVDSIMANTVYNEKDSSTKHNNKFFALSKEYCKLEDLLTFNIKKLRTAFREYGEVELRIDNNKLFRMSDLSEQISYNRIVKRDEKFIIKNDLPYSSFFYFYSDDNLYESLP